MKLSPKDFTRAQPEGNSEGSGTFFTVYPDMSLKGSRNLRKGAKVVTMSLEGGGLPPVTSFWGYGGGLKIFGH